MSRIIYHRPLQDLKEEMKTEVMARLFFQAEMRIGDIRGRLLYHK